MQIPSSLIAIKEKIVRFKVGDSHFDKFLDLIFYDFLERYLKLLVAKEHFEFVCDYFEKLKTDARYLETEEALMVLSKNFARTFLKRLKGSKLPKSFENYKPINVLNSKSNGDFTTLVDFVNELLTDEAYYRLKKPINKHSVADIYLGVPTHTILRLYDSVYTHIARVNQKMKLGLNEELGEYRALLEKLKNYLVVEPKKIHFIEYKSLEDGFHYHKTDDLLKSVLLTESQLGKLKESVEVLFADLEFLGEMKGSNIQSLRSKSVNKNGSKKLQLEDLYEEIREKKKLSDPDKIGGINHDLIILFQAINRYYKFVDEEASFKQAIQQGDLQIQLHWGKLKAAAEVSQNWKGYDWQYNSVDQNFMSQNQRMVIFAIEQLHSLLKEDVTGSFETPQVKITSKRFYMDNGVFIDRITGRETDFTSSTRSLALAKIICGSNSQRIKTTSTRKKIYTAEVLTMKPIKAFKRLCISFNRKCELNILKYGKNFLTILEG